MVWSKFLTKRSEVKNWNTCISDVCQPCYGLIFSLSFPPPYNTDNHSHKNKKVGSQVYAGVPPRHWRLNPTPSTTQPVASHILPPFNTIVHPRKNKKSVQGCPLARLKFDVCNSGSEKSSHRNQLNIVVIKNATKLYKNQVLGVGITNPTEFSNPRNLSV